MCAVIIKHFNKMSIYSILKIYIYYYTVYFACECECIIIN